MDVNILDDTKIKLIRKYPDGDSILVFWLGLLCLAMKSSTPGVIHIAENLPYKNDELADILDLPLKTVQLGIELFCKFGMIQIAENGSMEISNFREYQSIDQIEYKKQLNRERVAKYRAKHKELPSPCNAYSNVTPHYSNGQNREEEKREEKSYKNITSEFINQQWQLCLAMAKRSGEGYDKLLYATKDALHEAGGMMALRMANDFKIKDMFFKFKSALQGAN